MPWTKLIALMVGVVAVSLPVSAETITRERIEFVDGDTIRVDGVRMRLRTCDAPETREARCDLERARGERAAAQLHSILNSGEIAMETGRLDRYRRPLVDLLVGGTSVCETLISEALAVSYYGRGPRMDWCPRNRAPR